MRPARRSRLRSRRPRAIAIVCARPPATAYFRRPSRRSLRSALIRERRLGIVKIVTRPVQRPALCGHDTVTRIVDGRCRRGLETPSDGVRPELPLVGALGAITGPGRRVRARLRSTAPARPRPGRRGRLVVVGDRRARDGAAQRRARRAGQPQLDALGGLVGAVVEDRDVDRRLRAAGREDERAAARGVVLAGRRAGIGGRVADGHAAPARRRQPHHEPRVCAGGALGHRGAVDRGQRRRRVVVEDRRGRARRR